MTHILSKIDRHAKKQENTTNNCIWNERNEKNEKKTQSVETNPELTD